MFGESAGKIFLRYAVPQMIGLLFNSAYTIVDGVFIGTLLGAPALAAAGVAVPVVELLVALSLGMTGGAGVLIAGRLAAGQYDGARSAFAAVLGFQAAIALIIAVFGNLFLQPLARFLGATPEILPLALTYLRILVTCSPFLLFSYLLGGLARNDGRPGLAMVSLTIGSLSNIFLDWLFMVPFQMGIAGAALATAAGPLFSILILLPHFLGRKGNLFFSGTSLKRAPLRADTLLWFVRLGFPSFVMEFSIGMVTFVMNTGIVRYGFGEEGLAAYLLIGYLMLIVLTVFLGMAEGLQPAFSYLKAAGEEKRLAGLLRLSGAVFSAAGIACSLLAGRCSLPFYRVFAPNDPALAAFAASVSPAYFSCFFCAALNILLISYFQSVQASGRALLLSSLRGLFLPALFACLLPFFVSPSLLWACHSAAEAVTLIPALILLFRQARS